MNCALCAIAFDRKPVQFNKASIDECKLQTARANRAKVLLKILE